MTYDVVHMIEMTWFWWLFWLALVAAVFIVSRRSRNRRGKRSRETTDDMLRRRLADGEMTTEEYERYKALLDRDPRGAG